MADIDDILNAAMLGQPSKFADAFDALMGQKASEAIDNMRIPVAQSMFASDEDEEEDLEDIDDEDFEDIDDEDFEDIDWDDEEFDLDDEDLEGFEDDGEDA